MVWWLVQTTSVAAVLALIVAAFCRIFRPGPAVRHALWLLVLLKLVTPPLITRDVRWSDWHLPSKPPSSLVAVSIEPPPPLPEQSYIETQSVIDAANTPVGGILTRSASTLRPLPTPPPRLPTTITPAAEESRPGWTLSTIASVVFYVWIGSVAIAACMVVVRIRRFHRLLAWQLPAPGWLRRQVADIARLLSVWPPTAHVLPGLRTPFVWCFGRPKLLLPAGLMDHLGADSRRTVIAHELAHVRRRDHWVRWLELAAFLIWWWNPLFWLVRRRIRENAELACDTWVVRTLPECRRAYAEALIEVSRLMSHPAGLVPALGMGGNARQEFEGRLTMIMRDAGSCRLSAGAMAAFGFLAVLLLPSWLPAQKDDAKPSDRPAAAKDSASEKKLAETLKQARCDGKYAMLLRQINVPDDAEAYTEFRDFGMYNGTSYAGHDDLPPGHWVYAEPYWYIWRDLAATPSPKRAWGPEQVVGPPDTEVAGDVQTAWASRTQDEQDEWLLVEYAEPVVPKEVRIYETYHPGAVNRVTAFRLDGTEVEVWKGQDPTSADSDKGVSKIPVKVDFKTHRVKIYIASKEVPGWNEIDAVGLVDQADKTQWAVAVDASSTYAARPPVAEMRQMRSGKRAWGPEQVVGPPDTVGAGDFQTAWASLTEDAQDEWLQLDYAVAVSPTAVLVHENYNPGALHRVTAFQTDGAEVEVWKGKDPTRPGSGSGVSVIPVQTDFPTKRIRIYLASKDTPGWNEIDAVGLRDDTGKVQWATEVTASSTYAQQQRDLAVFETDLLVAQTRAMEIQRVMALEKENRELKKMVADLKTATPKDNGDAEFIRRIFIDLTGAPPTEAQVEAFTKDKAADKRVRLVEKIVQALTRDQ